MKVLIIGGIELPCDAAIYFVHHPTQDIKEILYQLLQPSQKEVSHV